MMDAGDLVLFERSLQQAVATHTGQELDQALRELGWHDALTHDTQSAVATLFSLQGAEHASPTSLDDVMTHGLALQGFPVTGVIWPGLGQWAPPGEYDGEHLVVHGLASNALPSHDETVVVARAGSAMVAAVVPTAALTVRRIKGMDPALELVEVTATPDGITARQELPSSAWSSSVALCQLAVGHELVGAARKMLELARQHAMERAQFGQVIGKFQAVRHRLAETLVAIEAADAMLGAAWEDGSPTTASVAKALAGRAGRTAARHCQQVLAGIGFTTEHELHRYVRRVLVLDALFGGSRTLTKELGGELLATQQLPALVPL
jgi:Acyl-CoA dehydrogenase, C-terminal domain